MDLTEPAVLATVEALRKWREARRRAGETLALIPTMGNLHAGHEALLGAARGEAHRVLATVFVNPAQFGPGEDYEGYPRTLERDLECLAAHAVDAAFVPTQAAMYPNGTRNAVTVEVKGISDILCGQSRPGHFRGVTSIVARLFNLTEPDVAVFGQKDYQQLVVIRRMTDELFFRVRIRGVPTVREPDGLAFSSRNHYLTKEERQQAPALYQALQQAARQLQAGADPASIARAGTQALIAAGFRPEYFEVRCADDLSPPEEGRARVILAAGWLGKARLIDNVQVN